MVQAEEADPEQGQTQQGFPPPFFTRSNQIKEILRGFEPKAYQGAVEKSVIKTVYLPPLEPEKEQEKKPFGGLFGKRCHQAAGNQIPQKLLLQRRLQCNFSEEGEGNRR